MHYHTEQKNQSGIRERKFIFLALSPKAMRMLSLLIQLSNLLVSKLFTSLKVCPSLP